MHDRLAPLIETLRRHTPATVDHGEITLGGAEPPVWDDEGCLLISLRAAIRDDDMVIDVREQTVSLGRVDDQPIARWQAYLEGTLRSAAAIVREYGGIEAILPHDLFAYALLDDPTLTSADEFAAQLSDPERLRAWNAEMLEAEWRSMLEPCGLADRSAEVRALGRGAIRLVLEALEGKGDRGDDEGDEWDEESDGDGDGDGDGDDRGVDDGEVDDEGEVDGEDDEAEDDDSKKDDTLAIGATRIGGDPDLPPDLPWPSLDGEPFIFVAQLDLAALAEHSAAAELPRTGVLSFFYSTDPPEGAGLTYPVKVLHFADPSVLVRRPAADPGARLPAFAVECTPEVHYPALESTYHYESLLPGKRVRAAYKALAGGDGGDPPIDPGALAQFIIHASERDFDRPTHQVLGHPSSIQGDPYLDVEMSLVGWEGWREGSDEAMGARRRSLGWRLLLQIDAYQDDELLLNQDGGFFYFFIPADALKAHDWSQVRGCLQCH